MQKVWLVVGLVVGLAIGHIAWAEGPQAGSKAAVGGQVAVTEAGSAAPATAAQEKSAPVAEEKPVPAAAESQAPVTEEKPGTATLSVEQIEIATAIENREPVGAADSFPVGTEKVYCFTRIIGGQEGDSVIHRWRKGDNVLGEISLKVNASPWRTYSSKTLGEEAQGEWTVEVLQGDQVIASKTFKIE